MVKSLIIRGSFDSASGYGAHIRSHLRMLERHSISFRLINSRLDPNLVENEEIQRWRKLAIKTPPPKSVVIHFMEACYYEIFSDCTNIGYTQWETDRLPSSTSNLNSDLQWKENMNRCIEIWTGSQFAKEVFERCGVKVPIHVVPWVVSRDFPTKLANPDSIEASQISSWTPKPNLHLKLRPVFNFISKLPSFLKTFAISSGYYLFESLAKFIKRKTGYKLLQHELRVPSRKDCFTILCSNTFNERKNLRDLVAAVMQEFSAQENVRLVIATHHAIFSRWMRARILSEIQDWCFSMKIENAPEVYVVTQKLSDDKFLSFLSLADIFVSTSRGEGVGGGVLLSMALGVPACTHLFSSFADFCNTQNTFVYDYSLEPVLWHFNFYGMKQRWARPNMQSLCEQLRLAYNSWKSEPEKYAIIAERARMSALQYGDEKRALARYESIVK